MWWLAAQEIPTFVNLGTAGAVLLLFVTGALVAKPIYQQAVIDRKDALQQRDLLVKDVIERVTPVLERAIEVINSRAHIDNEVLDILKDVRRLLERQ